MASSMSCVCLLNPWDTSHGLINKHGVLNCFVAQCASGFMSPKNKDVGFFRDWKLKLERFHKQCQYLSCQQSHDGWRMSISQINGRVLLTVMCVNHACKHFTQKSGVYQYSFWLYKFGSLFQVNTKKKGSVCLTKCEHFSLLNENSYYNF